jgi:hypothetical protein
LGLPAIVVENTSKLPSPDASFDAITFIACVNHILYRNRCSAKRSRRLFAANGRIMLTNLIHDYRDFGMPGRFWGQHQHQRDMTEGEVFGFTHRELVAPMTRASFKLQSRRPSFTRCLNALYVFGC